ncbi:MAG: DUF3604 domain-containing protein [Candidatus Thorarchaeota archaeon]
MSDGSTVSAHPTAAILVRILKPLVFFFGIFSTCWFFFSFIGLFIGIVFFKVFQGTAWSRHGVILTISSGVSPLLAHHVKTMAPLTTAVYSSIAIFVVYTIASSIHWAWFRFGRSTPALVQSINQRRRTLSQNLVQFSVFMVLISPIIMWSSVNLDYGVMFNNEPTLLWVKCPSTAVASESFEITVEAWDSYERLSATYKGTVTFSIESYNCSTYIEIDAISDLPQSYTFTGHEIGSDIAYMVQDGNDNGLHVFSVTIDTPGIHYILVHDSLTENTYYSNPVIIREPSDSSLDIFWGDVHNHSELSDGTGSAEHGFYYGRYVACLDFISMTDHGEIMLFGVNSLNVLEQATNAAYAPDQFVTFHGIEWTNTRTGHYTCIFSGGELLKDPLLSYLTIPTTDGLWDALDNFTEENDCRALALPHHTTQKQYLHDWTYINPRYVKIAEVTSVHGECLYEQRHPLNYVGLITPPPMYQNGTSIIDAFRMGYRMTLYAASDQHDGHPGHSLSHTPAFIGIQRPWSVWHTRNEHPYPGGLTAVYASDLTRDSIFTALERQMIYATSDYGRPLLNFTINGVGVGGNSTVSVSDGLDPRVLQIILAQDGAPAATRTLAATVTENWVPDWNARVEIIKNGELLTSITVAQPVVNLTYIDSTAVTGASYGVESSVLINGQYYINEYSDNPIDPTTLHTNGVDFYIIRIVGGNGRTTYIGPIWVEVS